MPLLKLQPTPVLRTTKEADVLQWARALGRLVDDRSGQLILPYSKIGLPAGLTQVVTLPPVTLLEVTAPGNFVIGGFAGGVIGRFLIMVNASAFNVTLNDHDAGTPAANQIDNIFGGNAVNIRVAILVYLGIWKMLAER